MRERPDNPSTNRLPGSMQAGDLVQAIADSGFPLQGRVADLLGRDFHVIEEWGFIDDETGEHRTLDVHAFLNAAETGHEVLPGASLLVECKRSKHPYVFFQTAGYRHIPSFPAVSGVFSVRITITDEQRTSRACSPAALLCLGDYRFVSQPPAICSAVSQALPVAKRVELSGADPFKRIVLPLAKALRHAETARLIGTSQHLIFPTVILAVCVLDAPMILVESPDAEPLLAPWVRVVRREAHRNAKGRIEEWFTAVDFVHFDYLATFVAEHVKPFVAEFANRVVAHADCLRYGATVPDLSKWMIDQIRPQQRRQ